MNSVLEIQIPLKNFLQIEHCPRAWRQQNVYVLRDDEVVFYVGQSYVAFNRVWQHFYDGFKGRSLVGRFILCNWPVSMHFRLELLNSRAPQFANLAHEREAVERVLIEQYHPCLNTALNPLPTTIPACYFSPLTAPLPAHHPKKIIREAAQVIKAGEIKEWLEQAEDAEA
jgi:hypothetical protein